MMKSYIMDELKRKAAIMKKPLSARLKLSGVPQLPTLQM